MSQRFYLPIPQIFTDLGVLAPGWKLYFYQTLTTTPLAVYSDTTLMTALPNPVLTNDEGHLIDGSGNITSIYFSDASLYKAVLKDENDVEKWTADPCDPFTVSIATLSPRPAAFAGTTAGTSTAYTLTANPPFTSYSSNDIFEAAFHVACGVSPTIQYVSGGAALNLKQYDESGLKVALASGDVQAQRYWLTNDSTDVVVLGLSQIATQAQVNTGTNTKRLITPLTLATKPGLTVQTVNVQSGAVATGTTTIPDDDTIPQITEGNQYMTLAITPTNASNKLKIDVVFNWASTADVWHVLALFQDAVSNALAAIGMVAHSAFSRSTETGFTHYMTAGTTSEITFRVRAGPTSAATVTFNGDGGARKLGGVMASSITITEIKV